MGFWSIAALTVSGVAIAVAFFAAAFDRAKRDIDAMKIEADRL